MFTLISEKMLQCKFRFACFLVHVFFLRLYCTVKKKRIRVIKLIQPMSKADATDRLKPVFLTKAQRQAQAVKRMEEKREGEKEEKGFRLNQNEKNQFEKNQNEKNQNESYSRTNYMSSATLEGGFVIGNKRINSSDHQSHGEVSKQTREERMKEKELEMIKMEYFHEKKKKKSVSSKDKGKVKFDWDATEDTSVDLNPLYSNKAEIALGFGRSYLGGIDHKEQQQFHTFYDALTDLHASGTDVTPMQLETVKNKAKEDAALLRLEQRTRANRHWSVKSLEEMTERDWRIFKEDFNIHTRGTKVPNPLRKWEEGNFPESIARALVKANYKEPSPIQKQAIPIGLQNRDIVGIAETVQIFLYFDLMLGLR